MIAMATMIQNIKRWKNKNMKKRKKNWKQKDREQNEINKNKKRRVKTLHGREKQSVLCVPYVCRKNIEKFYTQYQNTREKNAVSIEKRKHSLFF